MPVTAPLLPAKVLAAARRDLIDQVMNSTAPDWFPIADDEASALLAALDDDVASDYLASRCGTVDGAWRLFDLLSSLDRSTATPSQSAAVAVILALASYALNMRDYGSAYLGLAQDANSLHPLVELILAEMDRDADAQSFRSVACALGSRIEAA